MTKNLRFYEWFIGIFFVITFAPKNAFALNLNLACEGTEEKTFFHYDKNGKLRDMSEETKKKNVTLQIINSKVNGYPCREHEEQIFCDACQDKINPTACRLSMEMDDALNYISINRLTGQSSIKNITVVSVDTVGLRVISHFDGTCSKVRGRRF